MIRSRLIGHAFSLRQGALLFSLMITLSLAGYHLLLARHDHDSLLKRLDYLLYDWRYNVTMDLARPPIASDRIIIVDIDERSLGIEGRWPWSRDKLALLTNQLAEAGAVVVAFDIILSEPQLNPRAELLQQAQQQGLTTLANELMPLVAETDYDRQLAESFQQVDVVLSFLFHDDATIAVGTLPEPVYKLSDLQADRLLAVTAYGHTGALPVLHQTAVGSGLIVPSVDGDGVIRSAPLVSQYGQALYPSLALAIGMAYYLIDEVELSFVEYGNGLIGMNTLAFANQTIRTDDRGRVLIPYRGQRGQFPYVSATDVLGNAFDADLFNNALVLVGTSSVGLADLQTTPVGTQFPGVEIHANLLNGFLTGHFPYTPDVANAITATLLILLGLAYSLLSSRLGPLGLSMATLGLLFLLVGVNLYFWVAHQADLPLASSVLLTMALGGLHLLEGFLSERRSKQHVTQVFGQYVPKAHIEKMLANPDAYGFEGENREMTVLFSDIRSFTTLSESLTATELKDLLNRYFTPITRVIFDHQGTIDKYVGDLVMAFWGAPLEDEQHAHHALEAAVDMIAALDTLNPELATLDYPPIEVGIGLNSGSMNVGDMGSEYRRAYTVLGDAVNLASRLEGLTKYYSVKILVGPDTRRLCPDWVFRPIDRIRVKGKQEPVAVFEPLHRANSPDPIWQAELDQYHLAYEFYLQQNWHQARQAFTELAQLSRRPGLYQVYLNRITELEQVPPPADWDGTYTHTTK
ncbi:MAG: adenylate/guanylate cyclase domain-containing protein [Saccharospirillum sp.]|nr:adenylate/guanylate cyclase domain-containing protein [Saccharospirillum sp.]